MSTLITFAKFITIVATLKIMIYSIFYALKIHKKEYVSEATQKWKNRLLNSVSLSIMLALLTYGLILLILVLIFIGRFIDFLVNLVF